MLDYSRQRVDGAVLDTFAALADQLQLRQRIDAMFRGDHINTTEDRAVLHTALRRLGAHRARSTPLIVDGEDVDQQVQQERERMLDVRRGRASRPHPLQHRCQLFAGDQPRHRRLRPGPAMAVEALDTRPRARPRLRSPPMSTAVSSRIW